MKRRTGNVLPVTSADATAAAANGGRTGKKIGSKIGGTRKKRKKSFLSNVVFWRITSLVSISLLLYYIISGRNNNNNGGYDNVDSQWDLKQRMKDNIATARRGSGRSNDYRRHGGRGGHGRDGREWMSDRKYNPPPPNRDQQQQQNQLDWRKQMNRGGDDRTRMEEETYARMRDKMNFDRAKLEERAANAAADAGRAAARGRPEEESDRQRQRPPPPRGAAEMEPPGPGEVGGMPDPERFRMAREDLTDVNEARKKMVLDGNQFDGRGRGATGAGPGASDGRGANEQRPPIPDERRKMKNTEGGGNGGGVAGGNIGGVGGGGRGDAMNTNLQLQQLQQFTSLRYSLQHSQLVLLYFGSSWCPVCKPVTKQLSDAFSSTDKNDSILLDPYEDAYDRSKHNEKSLLSIIYVSSDNNEYEQSHNGNERYWFRVPWKTEERTMLKRYFRVCAAREARELEVDRKYEIPTILIIDSETGGILTTDGVQDLKRLGGYGALDRWKQLRKEAGELVGGSYATEV